MQRSVRYFIKNGKERKDCSVLLKRMDAQPWLEPAPQKDIRKKHFFCYLLWHTVFNAGFGICSFALRSKSLNLKSDLEWIALVALKKRATWANCSHRSLKKSNMSDLLAIYANPSQKQRLLKKFIFFTMLLPILYFPSQIYAQVWITPFAFHSVVFIKEQW